MEDGTQVLPTETPDITFDNVSFGYPGTEKNILNNISLTIKAGEKLPSLGSMVQVRQLSPSSLLASMILHKEAFY